MQYPHGILEAAARSCVYVLTIAVEVCMQRCLPAFCTTSSACVCCSTLLCVAQLDAAAAAAGHSAALAAVIHLLRSPSRQLQRFGQDFMRQHYHMRSAGAVQVRRLTNQTSVVLMLR
jgi:hypothetical protein